MPKSTIGTPHSAMGGSAPPALRALAGGVLLIFAAFFTALAIGVYIEGPLTVALGNLAICVPAATLLTWAAVGTWRQ